jgi:hypothetical protein
MNRMNIVLAATALVFAAGCLVLFTDVNDQRDRVRALEAQAAQLQRELTAAVTASQRVTTNTAARTSEPPAQAVAPAAPQSSSPASTPAVTRPAESGNDDWRKLLADPAYRRAVLAEGRLQMQREYPQLGAELGLSADEADRFFDLLTEQRLRENEQRRTGQDYMQWSKEFYAQAEKERRAFLGEERFRAWTEYVKGTQARGMVSDLRTQLATTSSPLRDEQVKPLVKALATEHERHTAERQENYEAENTPDRAWTDSTPASQQIEYMERRAALIQASLDRQQEAAQMYLDSVQQREFNALLDRRREQTRLELQAFRAQAMATERNRSRSR